MPQRTRMFRVWTCLAGSMTTGALVLSWLEPNATQAESHPPADLAAAVRGAVGEHPAGSGRWTGIAIVDVGDGVERGSLVATRGRGDVHFVLSATGQVIARSAWQAQRQLDDADRIRIGLASSSSAGREVQVRTLQALLEALTTTLARTPERSTPEVSWEAFRGDRTLEDALVRQLGEMTVANRV